MYTTVQKWGNSQGIRIPKALLDALNVNCNDRIELIQADDAITIRKAVRDKHITLEERLVSFYGKPVDEIDRLNNEEIDWGRPDGHEIW